MPTVGFLPMTHSTYGLLLSQMTSGQLVHKCFPSPKGGHTGCVTQKSAQDAVVQRSDSQAQNQQDLHTREAPAFAEWRAMGVLLSE